MESSLNNTALIEFDRILNDLLQFLERNKTVSKELQSRLNTLPNEKKQFLDGLFSFGSSEKNTESTAPIRSHTHNSNGVKSLSQIVITTTLEKTFEEWSDHPDKYFIEESEDSSEYHWGIAVGRLEQRECAVEVNRIKSRFEKLNMFRSAVQYGYHTGSKWSKNGSDLLVEVIQRQYPSFDEKQRTDTKRLEKAVSDGRNYAHWSKILGGDGYLAALPQTVHEATYYDRHGRSEIQESCKKLIRIGIQRIVQDYDLISLGKFVSNELQDKLHIDPYDTIRGNKKRTSLGVQKGKTQEYKRRKMDKARASLVNHGAPGTVSANMERLGGGSPVHESQHTRANGSENVIEVNRQTELDNPTMSTQNWNIADSALGAVVGSRNHRLSHVHSSPHSHPRNAELLSGQTSANNNDHSVISSPANHFQDIECSNSHRQSGDPLELVHCVSRSRFNEEDPGNRAAFRTCARQRRRSTEENVNIDTSIGSAPQPRVRCSENQRETGKTWPIGLPPDSISPQDSSLWRSAEYHQPNPRDNITSNTPANENVIFQVSGGLHQYRTAEPTIFPSMDRNPDHVSSLYTPESQSDTNGGNYPDQSVYISQESTEHLNSTAQAIDTLHPYLFPRFTPPSPVDTMSPSSHPQFVPPASIDTTMFSSYPQFTPLDLMRFSDYPQYFPRESDMGNLFNNT